MIWFFQHLGPLEKITLRAALAALVSFVLALLVGRRWIAWLGARFREPIKSPSPLLCRLQRHKEATPTMGGLFIVAGLLVATLVLGDLRNRFVQLSLLATLGLATLGAADDLVKLFGTGRGLRARTKLLGQVLIAALVAVPLYYLHAQRPDGLLLRLPLLSGGWSLGVWFVPLAMLVIVGTSNAVNLTDGLDGLAGGCLIFAFAAMTAVVYASGHATQAEYLGLLHVPGAGEMTILCGGILGGLLGFLWFNCHPAQVFMGDTGSLPLGGLLAMLALTARQEVLLFIVGGVFVVETVSVILQVGSYKWRGKRIFLCAPLHHHFQFRGWPETRIVVRFWIAAAVCALLAVATLKWNAPDAPLRIAAPLTAGQDHVRR
jgi:phospho-N-acetylmuramoyl-pentapeptide-transferase